MIDAGAAASPWRRASVVADIYNEVEKPLYISRFHSLPLYYLMILLLIDRYILLPKASLMATVLLFCRALHDDAKMLYFKFTPFISATTKHSLVYGCRVPSAQTLCASGALRRADIITRDFAAIIASRSA